VDSPALIRETSIWIGPDLTGLCCDGAAGTSLRAESDFTVVLASLAAASPPGTSSACTYDMNKFIQNRFGAKKVAWPSWKSQPGRWRPLNEALLRKQQAVTPAAFDTQGGGK
jgi:hypothetical protein